MKPIKCWIASDSDGATYAHKSKPIKDEWDDWNGKDGNNFELGMNLVSNEKPVKCVIITERYYKELLEEARLK